MTLNTAGISARDAEKVWEALDGFKIEVPSWGFSNTGTRFGKFVQDGAATTIEEKFCDAAQVNSLTGASPTVALHVLWDLPNGIADVPAIQALEHRYGVKAGSINPNLFQDQQYKFGSIANPDAAIRSNALAHLLDCIEIGKALGSMDLSMWIADGSSYPGSQSMRNRIGWMEEVLGAAHASLGEQQRMLLEYKPFEPYFYHTDIADWGMAVELARRTGPKAKVLVDTGHHYQGTNIEQIVTWLLYMKQLGGFHFNDRKYADDDLTFGSIDPYQAFRIFHAIWNVPAEERSNVAFMIDQSHNLKDKVQAMVQTVTTAQELYAKAALVDQVQLAVLQQECKVMEAEECFRGAFWKDVRPVVREWRLSKGLPADPLQALRENGYMEKIASERAKKNSNSGSSYA